MANNVKVNVSLDATAFQAGTQQFTSSVTAMQNSITGFANNLVQTNQQINQLIAVVNQLTQANQNANHTFGAFVAANLATQAIREFTDALKELIIESTLYAARTEELGVALSAIAKASGESTRVIAQQEFAMKQLNITTQDARQTLARFIQADLDLNKSGALARTAQDLAVIAGVSTSEEINKLIIGIQTLQSRNLRTAGVFLTVDEVLDRLAKTSNRARDSFSTFEKQQAVLNAVLEFGTRVTGTYEAAMETASKQIRSLERLIFEAQNAIGQFFVPVLNLAVKAITELFVWIEGHPRTFLILSTGAALVAASFAILNTRLYQTLTQVTTLTLVGFVRMIASLRLFPVNVAAATASIEGFTGATIGATAAVTGFQLALGGIGAALGIAGLIIGLTAAFTDLEAPADKFTKITDTQITQSSNYIRSIQERRKAVEEYRQSLQLVEENPLIGFTEGALNSLSTADSSASNAQSTVDNLQKQISALRAEEQDLNQKILRSETKDIITEATVLNQLIQARNQNNNSLSIQNARLDAATKINESAQKARKIAIDQVNELTGGNRGLVLSAVEVENATVKYYNILKELTPNERAVLAAQDERANTVDRLVASLDVLERRESAIVAARIAGLASNIKIARQEEQIQLQSINTGEDQLIQLQKQLDLYEKLKATGTPYIVDTSRPSGIGNAPQLIQVQELIDKTQESINDTNKAISESGTKLDENQGKLAEQYRQLILIRDSYGGSTEELYNLLHSLGQFPGTLDQFNTAFAEAENFMKGFADQADKVARGTNAVAEQIRNLKFPAGTLVTPNEEIGEYLNRLEKNRQDFIDDLQRRNNISREAAIQSFEADPEIQARFVKQFDQGFKKISEFIRKEFGDSISGGLDAALLNNAFDDEGKVKQQYEGLFKIFEEIQKAAKKAARETKSEFERMAESLERTEEQVKSFLNAGSAEFNLRIKLEDAERMKKDLEAIFTLRHKLGIPLDIPIKRENVQKTRQELEVLAKLFDEVREANNAVFAARLGAGAPVINAEIRAETQLLKLVRERRNEEQQLSADIAVAINKRIQLETNANDVRRLQARAFLEVLNEEQSTRENAILTLNKIRLRQGDFSAAQQNSIIQKGLQVANSPVIEGLTNIEKVISDSAAALETTQVDFTKALGDAVIKSATDVNGELRNHTNIQTQSRDYLQKIAENTTVLTNSGGPIDAYDKFSSVPNDTIHNYGNVFKRRSETLSQSQIGNLLAASGAPVRLIPTLTAIAMAESGGRVTAYNPGNQGVNENSLGLFQVNQQAHGNKGIFSDQNLYTPEGNVRAALEVLRKQGLNAWTTFTKGTYKKYLQGAYEGVSKSAFEFTQQNRLTKSSGIPIVQPFIDSLSGRGIGANRPGISRTEIFNSLQSVLKIGQGAGQLKLFDLIGSEEGIKGSTKVAEDIDNLRISLNERKAELEVRRLIVDNINEQHLADLRLTDDEKEFQRLQELRIDKQFQLAQQERELNSLRTGGIALQETLHETVVSRVEAEIEAEKEFIKTQEEINRRTDKQKREHDITLLLKKEYNQRINDELELDNRLAILRKQVDDGYFTSIDNRRRVEKQRVANRLQEQIDLTHRIIELDDELAHQGENSALRYSVAWREALLQVQQRHEDAVERILRAQASIPDQTTFDVARVRATVLEAIDKTEGISESIGGLFNNTFKVYSDDIDAWIDKTTEKMGNLGKIFNNFLKSVSHRVIGNVENSVLDAIFPSTSEEQTAKQAIQVGGLDQAEAAFKQLESSTTALGQVNLNTAQVTIETATALNGLTGSAAVASDALLQIGAIVAGIGAQGGGGSLTGTGALSGLLNTSIGGGGASGSGSLTSLTRAISGIGFGGLGSSPQSGGANAIQGIFGGAAGLNFTGGGGTPTSVTALLEKMRNQPLTTTFGPLATLSGLGGTSGGGGLKGLLSGVFGKGVGGKGGLLSLFSKSGITGLAAGLAPQLPFVGLGLGMSLGGPSKLGGILGGAGGLLLGGTGLAFLAPLLGLGGIGGVGGAAAGALGGAAGAGGAGGLLGTLTPFLTNPFTIAAGAALLVGAYFLGRKKQRQRDEKSRDELKGDAFSQIDQILKNVRADRMDGIDGITQAETIRDQYFQQISTLKTKSVKQSAENYRPYFDSKIEAIRREADLQLRRKEISDKLVPEFAKGGFAKAGLIKVQAGEMVIPLTNNERVLSGREQQTLFSKGGIVSGINRGIDDTFVAAHRDALVLSKKDTDFITQNYSFGLGGFFKALSPVSNKSFRDLTMPIFNQSVRDYTMPLLSLFDSKQAAKNIKPIGPTFRSEGSGDIIINMESSFDENGLALRIIGSNTGQRIVTNLTNQAVSDRRLRKI